MLLARAAETGIVAADLGAGAHVRHDRREMVVVVAMGAVDVAVMAVVVPVIMRVIMIVVAVGAMDVAGGLAVGRVVGHAAFPVRGWVFRGIAELPPVPKGAKWPESRWQTGSATPRRLRSGL